MSDAYTIRHHGTRPVRVTGKPRRVAGGYVVTVCWATDDGSQRLADGSVHPAHRAGFSWEEPCENLVGPSGRLATLAELESLNDSRTHEIAHETKYRGGRDYQRAVCQCGWSSTWQAGDQHMAVNAGRRHLTAVAGVSDPGARLR